MEKVLQRRKTRRGLEYLVKWKGFDVSENSWEPVANLENSKLLIDAFEKEISMAHLHLLDLR